MHGGKNPENPVATVTPLRKWNAALRKSCRKAGFSAAFLRIFKKAAEKLQIFLDLRKTCVFYKTAAEKQRLFLWMAEKLRI